MDGNVLPFFQMTKAAHSFLQAIETCFQRSVTRQFAIMPNTNKRWPRARRSRVLLQPQTLEPLVFRKSDFIHIKQQGSERYQHQRTDKREQSSTIMLSAIPKRALATRAKACVYPHSTGCRVNGGKWACPTHLGVKEKSST